MPHIHTSLGDLYWSKGNSKVKFPILSLGSGLDCPSRRWCPFDGERNKAAGRKRCYAQDTERMYPSVMKSRTLAKTIVEGMPATETTTVVATLAQRMVKLSKIIRLNEAGDLSDANIAFAVAFAHAVKSAGGRLYAYSKAPMRLVRQLRDAGATVLQSERQFIAAPTVEEGKATGLPRCPGICGPCKRCPDGKATWILEH